MTRNPQQAASIATKRPMLRQRAEEQRARHANTAKPTWDISRSNPESFQRSLEVKSRRLQKTPGLKYALFKLEFEKGAGE